MEDSECRDGVVDYPDLVGMKLMEVLDVLEHTKVDKSSGLEEIHLKLQWETKESAGALTEVLHLC